MKENKSFCTNIPTIIAMFLVLVLVLNIVPVQVQAETSSEHAPVTVYVDDNYENTSQEFDVGEFDVSVIKDGVGNDAISSIRIAQGYQVTLYEDSGFSGASIILTQDELNFENLDFNDTVSSLKVEMINPVDETCIQVSEWTDAAMIQIMQNYAPRIWHAQGETYFPSSVEYALPYMTRTWDESAGAYYYTTTETLSSPDAKLDYFVGDITTARCYAFWVEKDYSNIDISYFQYCPYDLGKTVLGTEFGNHVSDWEHITIRFAKFTYNGLDYLKPIQVKYPSHNFSYEYTWSEVTKIDGTHPVAYSALGSHGMWKDAGSYVYKNIVVARLTDVCTEGSAWDTWNCLETYEYSAQNRTGRGLGTTEWKSYFDVDYTNPDSLSVYQWGNKSEGTVFGQNKLSNGPSGPQEKAALANYVVFN